MSSKRKPRSPTPDAAPSQPSEPEYRPSDLTDGSEDEFEADLADEDGMKSKPGSNMDVDSDVEVEEEEDVFSLATELLDDEVLLERLLSRAEQRGDDTDEDANRKEKVCISKRLLKKIQKRP
ncbi:hypothetical protein B0H14DRAFT_3872018 [Mycena olivaceomarginata]|nr:hypothetical protein B0H14DRAFT_3872018 [Mycena olivaceomarginata]